MIEIKTWWYVTLRFSHVVVESAIEGTLAATVFTLAWIPPVSSLPCDLPHLPHTLCFGHAGLLTVPQLIQPLLLLLYFSRRLIIPHSRGSLLYFLQVFRQMAPAWWDSPDQSPSSVSGAPFPSCSPVFIVFMAVSLHAISTYPYLLVACPFHWNVSLNKGRDFDFIHYCVEHRTAYVTWEMKNKCWSIVSWKKHLVRIPPVHGILDRSGFFSDILRNTKLNNIYYWIAPPFLKVCVWKDGLVERAPESF